MAGLTACKVRQASDGNKGNFVCIGNMGYCRTLLIYSVGMECFVHVIPKNTIIDKGLT